MSANNRLILGLLFFSIALSGCSNRPSPLPPSRQLIVGMRLSDAERAARNARGHASKQEAPPASQTRLVIRYYEFQPHTQVRIRAIPTPAGLVVTGISVCRDANKPPGERRWVDTLVYELS